MGCLSWSKGGMAREDTGRTCGTPYGNCMYLCYRISWRLSLLVGSMTKILLMRSLASKETCMLGGNMYLLFLMFS